VAQLKGNTPKKGVQSGLRPLCTPFFGAPFTELRKSQIDYSQSSRTGQLEFVTFAICLVTKLAFSYNL
jgi:hypothetical protein